MPEEARELFISYAKADFAFVGELMGELDAQEVLEACSKVVRPLPYLPVNNARGELSPGHGIATPILKGSRCCLERLRAHSSVSWSRKFTDRLFHPRSLGV